MYHGTTARYVRAVEGEVSLSGLVGARPWDRTPSWSAWRARRRSLPARCPSRRPKVRVFLVSVLRTAWSHRGGTFSTKRVCIVAKHAGMPQAGSTNRGQDPDNAWRPQCPWAPGAGDRPRRVRREAYASLTDAVVANAARIRARRHTRRKGDARQGDVIMPSAVPTSLERSSREAGEHGRERCEWWRRTHKR